MDNPRLVREEDFSKIESSEEKIKFLLNYAVLAPSNHNAQPWLFKIKENSCEIYNDPTKEIKEADPSGRDLYISFGCLIENLVTAAKYFSVFERVDISPDKNGNFISEVFFKNLEMDISPDREYENRLNSVPLRINSRGVFGKKEVSEENIKELTGLNHHEDLTLHIISDKNIIDRMARLTEKGLHIAYGSKSFRMEMASWINNNFSKRREGIPGYSLRMSFIQSLVIPVLIRNLNMGRKVGKLNYKSVRSAPLITIVSSPKDDKRTWIEVGMLGERLMLEANIMGLKTSIFIAAIEMGDLYKDVQGVVGTNSRPQFLMCIGYMDSKQKANMRHSVDAKIIK